MLSNFFFFWKERESRGYDAELRSRGIDTIVKYGAAFRSNEVEVVMEEV